MPKTVGITTPFLKWAGGKGKLASVIREKLPAGSRLIEPFVGAGAIFLNTNYECYLLNDINTDLINLYKILKKHGKDFIDFTETFFIEKNNTPNKFYKFRDHFNSTHDEYEKSAIFIYFNRHGFNGLCRYNASGKFNVPYGKYKKPLFPREALLNFYQQAKKATFTCEDFAKTMHRAKAGDVIYCDPPYAPLSSTAFFNQYAGNQFDLNDQKRLAEIAQEVNQKGIPVLISNHDIALTREIYQPADITQFEVKRFISCKGDKREVVSELLALFD